jgi:hypothetical protein
MKRAAAKRQLRTPAEQKRVERLFGSAEDHTHLRLYDDLKSELLIFLPAELPEGTRL